VPEGEAEWHDSDGVLYNCTWYASHAQEGACQSYGIMYENFGMTANEACCACAAIQLATYGRTDSPKDWTDRPGKDTCATYAAEQWCTSTGGYGPAWDEDAWGTFDDHQRQGVSADEACVACGGGEACMDLTIGWVDSQNLTCGDYIQFELCTSGGDYGSNWHFPGNFSDYATNGQSAIEACCACGGGVAEGACAGESATFDAGWGDCATYEPGSPNHAFCAVDYDASQGMFAMHTCPHCGVCQQATTTGADTVTEISAASGAFRLTSVLAVALLSLFDFHF
jgi:hypothetical protein